jgi:hypothetical protein
MSEKYRKFMYKFFMIPDPTNEFVGRQSKSESTPEHNAFQLMLVSKDLTGADGIHKRLAIDMVSATFWMKSTPIRKKVVLG